MPDILVDNLTSIGLIQDLPAYQVPPEGFTFAKNVRFQNMRVRRIGGKSQPWTPVVAPMFHQFVVAPNGTPWWLYASDAAVYAYDFATHSDITGSSGPYSADRANAWFGTVLGGIPVLTDGETPLQYWPAFSGATNLEDLPAWPSTYAAKVIRAFENHLIALGITKSGTSYPHLVKWSHPADPGTVPSSWDETDPALDAGEYPLADVHAGGIQDGLQLGSIFYIYKESSTWAMRRIGGRFIFAFDQFLTEAGLLAPHCVTRCNEGGWHCMLTQDNLLAHDGSQVVPLLSRRMRQSVFSTIDQTAVLNSFVFHHPTFREVWACFPEQGNTTPNRAIVWQYGEGGSAGVLSEAEVDFVSAANGVLAANDLEWNEETSQTWESNAELWATNSFGAVVVARPSATKALALEQDVANDGAAFTATVRREALALEGRDRTGQWVVDWLTRKLVTRVWIRAEGGPISVRIGSQLVQDGPVMWTDPASFDPATQRYVDLIAEGNAVAIEFETTESVDWSLVSYTIEQFPVSRF